MLPELKVRIVIGPLQRLICSKKNFKLKMRLSNLRSWAVSFFIGQCVLEGVNVTIAFF